MLPKIENIMNSTRAITMLLLPKSCPDAYVPLLASWSRTNAKEFLSRGAMSRKSQLAMPMEVFSGGLKEHSE
jgi:hypothetical protein